MSRIRTIKPEFWTSEQVFSCSPMARLLFIGLWNFCDDNGIHPASYARLKAEVFPADNNITIDEMKQYVNELLGNKLLRQYAVNEETYWIVTGWRHQRIDKPTYKHPVPQSELKQIEDYSATTSRERGDDSTNALRMVDDDSQKVQRSIDEPSTTDRKGMDGNGKDKDICEVETSPCVVLKPKTLASTIKPTSDVLELFGYWQFVLHHPKARLDNKRQAKIIQALKLGYSIEELKQAIDGCAATPHNMGHNERNQRYDGIDLIFRDADHIERFMINAANPPIVDQSGAKLSWMEGAL